MSTLTYPDGEVVTYSYNALGELSSVSGYVTSMTWDSRGRLTQIKYANGTTGSFSYNANRSWLTGATVKKDSTNTTLYTASYSYDAAARVTAMTQGTPGASTLNFTYDGLSRLTGVSGAQSGSFAYDAIGNITSLYGASYTYGDPDHPQAVTAAGSKTYTYDANGNMLTGDGRTFTWDADNQLTSVVKNGVTTSFAYGPSGGRIKKVSGSNTTLYFGAMLEEVNGSPVQYYYAGPILVAKKEAGGAKYWYHADRLGSTRLMTDASGNEAKEYDYKPFGQLQASSGSVANTRTFTGHTADDETGLVYMGARYYDPALGRFISADTVVPDAGNPQALNRYAYVYNNPVNNTDPTGHAPVVAAVLGTIAAYKAGMTYFIIACIGAAMSIAGYVLQSPILSTIGGVLLGYGAGGPLGHWGGAAVAAATSPLSPLSPTLKQVISWAYTIYGLVATPKVQKMTVEEFLKKQGIPEGMGGLFEKGDYSYLKYYGFEQIDPQVWRKVLDGGEVHYLVTGYKTPATTLAENFADSQSCFYGRETPTQRAILNDIKHLGVDPSKVTVIGHSQGSWEAIRLGLNSKVGSVIALNPPKNALEQVMDAFKYGEWPSGVKMSIYAGGADVVSTGASLSGYEAEIARMAGQRVPNAYSWSEIKNFLGGIQNPTFSFTVLPGVGHNINTTMGAAGLPYIDNR